MMSHISNPRVLKPSKMKNLILLVAICLSGALGCKSAPTTSTQQAKVDDNKQVNTEKLKAQAQELNDAMTRRDYARAIDFMYPKLVELAGGKERLRAGMEEQMKQVEIVSNKVGEPRDMFKVNGESYAIVPSTMSLKVPEGILVGEGYMIAYSKDDGEHWTFTSANSGPAYAEQLKTLFPNAADKLHIPELKPPVLQKSPGPQ
jgi:hypothetical protein